MDSAQIIKRTEQNGPETIARETSEAPQSHDCEACVNFEQTLYGNVSNSGLISSGMSDFQLKLHLAISEKNGSPEVKIAY